MTTKYIKLADIAKEVGCSTATVSYVLNNDPKQKINEETRRKILQVSSILGYQKNTIANALATGKSNCIGFYIGSSSFPLATTDKFNFYGVDYRITNSSTFYEMDSKAAFIFSEEGKTWYEV